MPSGDHDLANRLEFLKLGEEELELLQDLRPALEKNADEFVAAFYRHLLAFEPTRRLLHDPEVKDRLLAKQRAYLVSLGDPVIDEGLAAERDRIGAVHERLGLEPRWYLGAYSLYFSLLTPVICHFLDHDRERAVRTVTALHKRLTLDADLAMQSYVAMRQQDLEYVADELAREGQRLARDYEEQSATLRVTAERARAAEELASIGTLVAGLAHEIGTPMGVIQGHAKLLESAVSGDDATWRLTTIQEQITRISRIIQTLLDMARPGPSGRRPVDLEALLERTVEFLGEKTRRHEVTPVTSFQPTPSVMGDPERLQQLFLNLFLNAIDAMDRGGELRISLDHHDGEVRIRIADDGAGIKPEDLEKIFDPFFTTKPAGEGNGLGLMVCKGIVSDHGGSIEVTSQPGEGTEFEISLPVAGSESKAAEPSG